VSGKGRAEGDGERERVLRAWVGERLGKHGRRVREGEGG